MSKNYRKPKIELPASGVLMLLKRTVQMLLAVIFAGAVSAQQLITLDSIGFANLPGDSIEIQLSFDSAPPQPSGFVLDNPARISLDLPGVASSLSQQRFNIDSNNAQSVISRNDDSTNESIAAFACDCVVHYAWLLPTSAPASILSNARSP